jgi:uncharacterized membrane protein YeaQ/YmgE (transglycosylase-associated protein family)
MLLALADGRQNRHVGSAIDNPPVAKRVASDISRKSEGIFMNIIIWLVVGGLIGWQASMVMRTDGQQVVLLINVAVGIAGALLGGWFLGPLVGISTIDQSDFSVAGLLVSLVGAVILLTIVNFVRRAAARGGPE